MPDNYSALTAAERRELMGSFHKSLPHDEFGQVSPHAFAALKAACTGPAHDFEVVPVGYDDAAGVIGPGQGPFDVRQKPDRLKSDRFVNPQAGLADESLGPPPAAMRMGPPPAVDSLSTAAEMTELYWMALLRDIPFAALDAAALQPAIDDLTPMFQAALDAGEPGGLRLGQDLPGAGGAVDLRPETLFRCGLKDEDNGPLVSQFFLHDAMYGAQLIVQKQRSYRSGLNFLTDVPSWLLAQNSGWDAHKIGYGDDRLREFPDIYEELDANGDPAAPHRIRSMRDLARFVNRDALHQAYFTAALLLLDWGAPLDRGNPYAADLKRQGGFGTLGPPHLLALVSEVASRALKVVWRQKWVEWRRLRPEAYGGLAHFQDAGARAYGLPDSLFKSEAAGKIRADKQTLLLPMAFPSGSPVHPAYGAGHACVAGACVTILKAWFDEDKRLGELFNDNKPVHPFTRERVRIVAPDKDGSDVLPSYQDDISGITVGGELNKLACNVAMGRSMGGVHWRSDNTRSLRLGERVAAYILAGLSGEFHERVCHRPPSWTFTSFSGREVVIEAGQVNGRNRGTLFVHDL